ncbi:MAG: GAF domain-containing protein, partial [Chloroflexi bacterium]|nr:GAF domain-containing protein [Chloroflexota bacterium]
MSGRSASKPSRDELARRVRKQARELRAQIAQRQAIENELRESRDEIEQQVEARTRALADRARMATFTATVGLALNREGSLADGLRLCAEAMVEHLDAAFARIWLWDAPTQTLILQASAGMNTRLDGTFSRHPLDGDTRIAIIARERKPYLTNAAIDDPGIKNKDWARAEKMIAFAGYPLIVGDRLLGVMALFARQPLSQITLDALDTVANSIALGIERIRAEASLRHEQILFTQAPAIVFRWRATENWPVEYVSANVSDQWGYAVNDLMSGKIPYASLVHPADLERVAREVQTHSAAGASSFKQVYRIRRADG